MLVAEDEKGLILWNTGT